MQPRQHKIEIAEDHFKISAKVRRKHWDGGYYCNHQMIWERLDPRNIYTPYYRYSHNLTVREMNELLPFV